MSDESPRVTSRISGFHRERIEERIRAMVETGLLSDESKRSLEEGGRLELEVADHMSENVIAIHGLPFSIALNFRVNRRDVFVPMAVEEPSIVAAASGVRAGFELMGVEGTAELAVVMAAAGLASNFAAIRALAGEGIQRGHMRLHSREKEVQQASALPTQRAERGGR